jgi:hypothetical protein
MPGIATWEGDTHGTDLLVAESEPDYDATTGPSDRHQEFSATYLGVSYRLIGVRGAVVRGDLRGRAGEVEQHGEPATW